MVGSSLLESVSQSKKSSGQGKPEHGLLTGGGALDVSRAQTSGLRDTVLAVARREAREPLVVAAYPRNARTMTAPARVPGSRLRS